jgi:autotransporter-associated beta strand protein
MKNRFMKFALWPAVTACGLLTALTVQAQDTDTWTGNSSATANFSDAANWAFANGGTTVSNGDYLIFAAANNSGTTLNNDLNDTFAGITFTNGASAYTLGGNLFGLAGGITNNGGAQTINNNITLAGNETVIDAAANITLGGSIGDNGSGFGLNFPGAAGAHAILMTGANTYSGNTVFGGSFGGVNNGNSLDFNGAGSATNSVLYLGVAGSGNATYLVDNPSTSGLNLRTAGLVYNGVALGGNNYQNFTINATSAGQALEYFGALTLNPGSLEGTINTASAGNNVQVLFSGVTRNPGSIFYFGRINGNTSTLGTQPVLTASGNGANIIFTNLSASGVIANLPLVSCSVGGTLVQTNPVLAGALYGTPYAPVLPWTDVGQNISTYDTNYGVRALQSAEQVTLANGLAPGQNAKITTGNFTLTGNLQVNSFFGSSDTITLAGYTLSVASGAIEGSVSLVIGGSVNDGYLALGQEGVFYIDNTRHTVINSVITGTQGLTVHFNDLNNNTAYCVLNGANTFSGVTRVVGNNNAMLLELGNSLALQNSTLDYNNYGATIKFISPGNAAQTFGGLEGQQNLSIAGVALTVGGDGDSTTYGGVLSGTSGSLIKIGTGTLTLTNLNTYTGGTTISNGQLNINNGGSSSANSAIGTGALTLLGGAFDNTSGSAITLAPNNTEVWNGNFTFNGTASLNLGTGSVTLGGNSQVTVNASTLTVGGVISGNNVSLTKAGSGTLALSGASTYSGNTVIGGGILALTGSAGIGSSPSITVSNGATLDVSGLASTFTLGGSQSLAGGGTINGPVSTTSGSAIYADSGAAYGTNTFNSNLTLASGATVSFNLGTAANGANDLIVVGGNLTNNLNIINISAPSTSVSLAAADYTLFKVGGTIAGSFAGTPNWVVKPVNYDNYSIIKVGNTIVLHYQIVQNPALVGFANPSSVSRGQSTVITGIAIPGTDPISSITVNATPIGGAAAVTLVQSNSTSVYTNAFLIGSGTPSGSTPLTATVTDSQGNTGTTNIALTILPGTDTWSGGSTTDNNWSDPANWVGGAAPLNGDAVTFAGSTRLNPVMDYTINLSSVTFASGAGSFVITNAPGKLLTLSGGVVNNSANAQALNTPISLGTAQTMNAAAGNITLGGAVSGSASLTETGTNLLTLAGANSYSSGTTVNAGTLVVANNAALGSGALTLAGGSISNSAGISYSLPNNVVLSSPATAGVGAGDTLTLAGTISGGGSLTETGNGALALASANTFSGGATVSSGTLVVGNSTAVGSGLLTVSGFGSISNAPGVPHTLANTVNLTGEAGFGVSSGDTLSLIGVITNVGGLNLTGSGTLEIGGTQPNTYSGGTVLNAGSILDVETSSSTPLGTNTLTFAGGTVEDLNGSISATIPNNITVVTNTTSYLNPTTFDGIGLTLAGNISGPGNLVVNGTAVYYDAFALTGNNSGFTGTFTVNSGNYQRFEFGSASSGSPNAAYVLNNTAGVDTAKTTFGAGTFAMGSLSGTGLLRNDAAALTTLSIGGLNTNATWGGILQQGGSANLFAVIKVGTGIETFTNDNTYTGTNEVAQGTFEITSVQQTAQPLQVDDGATFGLIDSGSGQSAQIASMVLGTNLGANLLFTNIYAAGAAPAYISDGELTVNGTCVVTLADTANLSPGNVYTLLGYSTFSGSGNFLLAPLPGGAVGGLINDPGYNGLVLSLPATTIPTNITLTVTSSGGATTLGLAWPYDHQGWVLETNSAGLNVSGAWGIVSGSEYTTSENFNVDPTQTNVFYRLVLP